MATDYTTTQVQTPSGVVTVRHPANASKEEILRYAKRQTTPAPPSIQETIPGKVVRYGQKVLNRFLPDAAEAVEETVESLSPGNIGNTVSGMAGLAGGMFEKAGRKFEEFATGEEIAPTPGKEDVADQAIEMVKENLGTPEAALETVTQHPFDTLTALSGLPGMSKVGPMNWATGAASIPAKAGGRSLYRQGMNIPRLMKDPVTGDYIDGNKLVDDVMGKGDNFPATVKGWERLKEAQDEAGEVIGREMQKAQDSGALIDIGILNRGLVDLIKKYEGVDGGAAKIAEIQKLRERLYGEFPNQQLLTPDQVQHFKKQAWSDVYEAQTVPETRFNVETQVKRNRGGQAKGILEQINPDLVEPNARFGRLAELEPWLAKAVNRGSEIADEGFKTIFRKTIARPDFLTTAGLKLRQLADGNAGWMSGLTSHEVRVMLWMAGQYEAAMSGGE